MMNHLLTLLFTGLLLAAVPGHYGLSQEKTTPFILGSTIQLHSAVLNEDRVLNIYLPEGYNSDDTSRYPIIYLLDGSANEDFIHVVGLVQFFNMMQMMPPSIVTGIANVNRRRDFTFPSALKKDKATIPAGGGSASFISFLETEVQPYVRSHYRTGKSTLIGQSLGGLLATEILTSKPQLFNNYIIVSPSLWWGAEALLARKITAPQGTAVYVAVGKEGTVMETDARALADKLRAPKRGKVVFDYLAKEDHATILHQAVYNAFKALYSKHK